MTHGSTSATRGQKQSWFLVGLIVTVVGFILALAVHPTHPGSVNVNTVGWILVVFGLIAFFADLVLLVVVGARLRAAELRRRRGLATARVRPAGATRGGA